MTRLQLKTRIASKFPGVPLKIAARRAAIFQKRGQRSKMTSEAALLYALNKKL